MAKYYKKVVIEKDWEQPIAINSVGGSSFGVQVSGTYGGSAINLFDKDNSTYWDGGGPRPTWFTFYNPNPIKVSRIQTYSNNSSWTDTNVTITASNDNSNWKTLATITLSQANTQNWDIPVDKQSYYKYYRYTSNSGGASSNLFNEVYITATELTETWQECTKAEYDQLPADQRKIVTDTYNGFVRKKYLNKKTVEKAWTQPVLSANGTLGGGSFAVGGTTPNGTSISGGSTWVLFNNNPNNTEQYVQYTTVGSYIIIYNPTPLNITAFNWLVFRNDLRYFPRKCTVYGSNDNKSWDTLGTFNNVLSWNLSSNTNYYKYHKVVINTLASSYTDIRQCNITATQQTQSWQECTKEEYDNSLVYYKKIETPWTRPILTSDGTLGGNSFAVAKVGNSYNGDAYQTFDGSTSTAFRPYVNNGLIFYNPKPLNITNLACNVAYANEGILKGELYASNDNSAWELINNNIGGAQTWSTNINMQGRYKYFKLMSTSVTGGRGSVAELIITATEQTWQQCTKEEYDLLPDSDRMLDSSNRKIIPSLYSTKKISGYRDYSIKFIDSNIQTVGTDVTIDSNGISSGYTTSSYLKYNTGVAFDPSDGSDFEVNIAFKLPTSATGGILIGTDNNRFHYDGKYGNFYYYAGIRPTITRNSLTVELFDETKNAVLSYSRCEKFYTASINYTFDTTTTYVVNIKKLGTSYITTLTDINNSFTQTYTDTSNNIVNQYNRLIGANLYEEGGTSTAFDG